jgi:hypothetical protein
MIGVSSTRESPSTLVKYRHRVLAWLSTLSVITYLDRVCISIAGPRIQVDATETLESPQERRSLKAMPGVAR